MVDTRASLPWLHHARARRGVRREGDARGPERTRAAVGARTRAPSGEILRWVERPTLAFDAVGAGRAHRGEVLLRARLTVGDDSGADAARTPYGGARQALALRSERAGLSDLRVPGGAHGAVRWPRAMSSQLRCFCAAAHCTSASGVVVDPGEKKNSGQRNRYRSTSASPTHSRYRAKYASMSRRHARSVSSPAASADDEVATSPPSAAIASGGGAAGSSSPHPADAAAAIAAAPKQPSHASRARAFMER